MAETVKSFGLTVIAADRVFYEGRAFYLRVNTIQGFCGFMANRASVMMALSTGELKIETADGQTIIGIASGGILSCANNRITVIVDSCEHPDEIDEKRAEEAKDRALERLRQKQSIGEYKMTQASLARALTRLKYEKKHYI